MAWPIKEKLKWNKMDHTRLKGEALKKVEAAFAALEAANKLIAEAKLLAAPAFDGKTFPAVPAGKVVRLSFQVDPKGVKRMSAAAATPSESSADSDDFSW